VRQECSNYFSPKQTSPHNILFLPAPFCIAATLPQRIYQKSLAGIM
jgi:hypothetical protein